MDDKAVIRSFETGLSRRWLLTVALLVVVVGGIVAWVVVGFSGKRVSRSADALINPTVIQTHPKPSPPPTQR